MRRRSAGATTSACIHALGFGAAVLLLPAASARSPALNFSSTPAASNHSALALAVVLLQEIVPGSAAPETRCVGTIIGTSTVLTAAQCFVDPAGEYSRYVVAQAAGDGRDDAPLAPLGIQSIFLHPDFNRVDLHNDVAVVHVNGTFPLGTTAAARVVADAGTTCFDDSLVVVQLSSTQLNFTSGGECVDAQHCEVDAQGDLVVNDTVMFCTELDDADAVPAGQGGGVPGAPLFVLEKEDGDEWLLLGVASSRPYNVSTAAGGGHNGPQVLRANARAGAFHDFLAAVGNGSAAGFPTDCVDCAGAPCGHYVAAALGDGACDRGAWGPDFSCEAFSFDAGDCVPPGPGPNAPCMDCLNRSLDCAAAAAGGGSVLRVYELLIGDGVCHNGNSSGNSSTSGGGGGGDSDGGGDTPDLNCALFAFDGGDCEAPAPPVGLDGATGACQDCSGAGGQDCSRAVAWLGDGFCDGKAGTFAVDFNCSAFAFDGGDCRGAVATAEATTARSATTSPPAPPDTPFAAAAGPTTGPAVASNSASLATPGPAAAPTNGPGADATVVGDDGVVVVVSSVTVTAVVVVVAGVVGLVLWKKSTEAKAEHRRAVPKGHQALAQPSKTGPGGGGGGQGTAAGGNGSDKARRARHRHRNPAAGSAGQGGRPDSAPSTPSTLEAGRRRNRLGPGEAAVQWACPVCTHRNVGGAARCGACDTPHDVAAQADVAVGFREI